MNAQHLFMDIISILPQSIIETILCLLPIQEAARTSILSRDWRYKWTTIPKLDFIEWKFNVSIDETQLAFPQQTPDAVSQMKSVIKRCLALNQLRLRCDYRLPLSIFNGFGNLTSLYLCCCDLYFEPTFNGFSRLTSLYLHEVVCPSETLLLLISNCPLLKSFTLITEYSNVIGTDKSAFLELFECLPMIEHLTLSGWFLWPLLVETGRQELPFSSVCLKHFCLDRLKYLCVDEVDFMFEKELPSLVVLIRSSPNLEKIKLEMSLGEARYSRYELDSILENYSDIWLEHLTELEIEGMNYLKTEWEFVMLILAKSPVLRKLSIRIFNVVTKDEEMKLLRILLRAPRASPLVDIIVERSMRYLEIDNIARLF